jgi:hypothetical protein
MPEFELICPNGIHIRRGLKESEVAALQEFLNIHRKDMRTGWVWYQLPQFEDAGMQVGISLAFLHGTLKELSVCDLNADLYGKGWDEMTEEKERLRAANTAKWLERRGYPPDRYDWGEVWASYDPKGGTGSGGVRYK